MANRKQSQVNSIFGRVGVRLWGLYVLGSLLSIGIVGLMIVLVLQPASDASAQVNNIVIAGLALIATAVLAIFVTGFYVTRRVMRPLMILRQGAAQLAAGKFDTRITGVNTNDELEFLAAEFNDLAAKLQVAQTSTVEAVREREEQYQTAQRRVREMSTLLKAGPRHHVVGFGKCAG